MPNVKFLRGLHDNLWTTSNGELVPNITVEDGAFYLTTDTNRLYVGKTNANQETELVELNESIHIVADLDELYEIPYSRVRPGQFYYVQGKNSDNANAANTHKGNILAVCVGEMQSNPGYPEWIQVNPDTNTNTDYNDNTFVTGNTNGTAMQDLSGSGTDQAGNNTHFVYKGITNNTAHYELVVTQKSTHNTSLSAGTDTYENNVVAKLDLDLTTLVASASKVGVTGSLSNNNTTMIIGAAGTGADVNQKLNITAGTNISFAGSKDNLTINATDTKYDLDSPAGSTDIVLKTGNDETQWDKVSIEGGTNIEVTGTNANKIAINHGNPGTSANTYGSNAATPQGEANVNLTAANRKFIVPSINVDAKGHIVSGSDQIIQLPQADPVTAVTANSAGQIVISQTGLTDVTSSKVTDPNDNTKTVGPLYYQIGHVDDQGNITKVTVENQGDLGDYYTKAAIDRKLQGLDALTYKGTVGTVAGTTVSSLPSHPSNGDTYKVANSGTYGGNANCEAGDLLIATGYEYQDTDSTKVSTYIAPNDPNHDSLIGTIVSPTWTHIAHGDDTDTTYTFSVNGTTLKYKASSSGGADPSTYASFVGGNELSATGSGSTITIDHDKVLGHEAGTTVGPTAGAVAAGTSFDVPYFTVNDYGHITSVENHAITLPPPDVGYTLSQADNDATKFILNHGNANAGEINFENGTRTSVTTGTNTIAIDHTAPTAHTDGNSDSIAGPTTNETPSHNGGSFVVPEIFYDNLGHITGHVNRTVALPADLNTTYTLSSLTNNNAVQIKLTAGGTGGNGDSTISINSSTLNITTGGSGTTTTLTADLMWGSFDNQGQG